MTVVAFDGHVMAADSMVRFDGKRTTAQKVFATRRGIIGWCGNGMYAMSLMEWIRRGAKPEAFPRKESTGEAEEDEPLLLIADERGLSIARSHPRIMRIAETRFAVGSGSDFAIGAMDCGASAIRAVEIAIERSATCRGPVQWLSLAGGGAQDEIETPRTR